MRAGRGLVDNGDPGGKRQVAVVCTAAWREAVQELGLPVDPSARRANLLVTGIDLEKSRGRILQIGEARILLHGETRPCERMEETCTGLRTALSPHWRAGAYGEVLEDAGIRVGDGPVAARQRPLRRGSLPFPGGGGAQAGVPRPGELEGRTKGCGSAGIARLLLLLIKIGGGSSHG